MKIPEHDIIDVKWLIARATFAAMPREEERRAAAQELFDELVELNGLHGIVIDQVESGVRVAVPGGASATLSYSHGAVMVARSGGAEKAPIAYDAGLRGFIGAEIKDAPAGRNGNRPRMSALVALMRTALGEASRVEA